MSFESELKKGNFIISECTNCQKIVWPPSEFCNQCFSEVSWRNTSNQGKIVEFSKQNNDYFCIVEIENAVKIIGSVSNGIPNVGQCVKIDNCGMKGENYYFEMSLI
jgi:uncharacterized OB-fold protein